jgi:cathepsin H
LTDQEFRDYFRLGLNEEQKCSATSSPRQENLKGIPDNFDWQDYGVVTPVKSQGKCGSCWTFSTIGALESHYYISTARYMNFSEQVLVDCAREEYDCHGCKGGLPSYAFNFIRDHGMATNETYPYRANDGKSLTVLTFLNDIIFIGECKYTQSQSVVTTDGPFNITTGDEIQLVESIFNHGPVSVAFQVIAGFRDYKDGVYYSSECKNSPMDVNHAVLAVGYGVEDGHPFLNIKNSWGRDWGNKGFFKIARNRNMCGIAVCNSFPLNVRVATHSSQ